MPKNVQVGSQIIEFPDSMSDDAIAGVLRANHPPPSTHGAQMGAPANPENPVTNYLQDVGNDLTKGGSRTAVGRALGYLQGGNSGYSGLNNGVGGNAANILGSPVTGPVEAAQGLAMTPQHPVAGPIKALMGALKTMAIPSMVMTGPGAAATIDMVPSTVHAGRVLNDIADAAGNSTVPLSRTNAPLQRLAELGERGGAGSVPPGVNQLLTRSQSPIDLAYPEARDFASNISSLSALEKMGIKPQVGAQMNALRSGLHGDIADSLQGLGLSEDYLNAIREYAQASRNKDVVKKIAKKAALGVGAALAGKGAIDYGRTITGGR